MFYSQSKVQPTVPLSTAESETAAAVTATCDIIWFRNTLEELGFPQAAPTTLFSDNASMIAMATRYSGNHKRIRHFMTKVNFLIQHVEDSLIDIVHLAGEDMPADILTKPLAPGPHAKHTARIMTSKSTLASPTTTTMSSAYHAQFPHPPARHVHFPHHTFILAFVQQFHSHSPPSSIVPYYIHTHSKRKNKRSRNQ